MTSLAAMNEAEFLRFREYSLDHFADLCPSTALARQEFDKALPDGLRTPGQHLFTLSSAGTALGFLWWKAIERATGTEAFLLDLAVYPEHRRQGHAKRALQALEAQMRGLGAYPFPDPATMAPGPFMPSLAISPPSSG